MNVGDLAKTKVLVRAEDADAARDLIAASDTGMLAPDVTDTGPAIRGAMLALAVVIAVVVAANVPGQRTPYPCALEPAEPA